jgi:hypothetical protein
MYRTILADPPWAMKMSAEVRNLKDERDALREKLIAGIEAAQVALDQLGEMLPSAP